MDRNLIFKYILIGLLCGLTGIRLYYKWRSGVLFESSICKEPRHTIALRYLTGSPLFASVFMTILFPDVLPYMYLEVPLWLRITGAVFCLGCLVLLVWTHHALDGYFSMTLTIKQDHHLVTQGPYRWIRHPMYVAYFLFFFNLFFVTQNWILGVSGMAVILTLMTVRLKKEELLLEEHFKDVYFDYELSTPRFFPRLDNRIRIKRKSSKAYLPMEEP